MLPAIYAMKGIGLARQTLQIYQAGEGAYIAAQCYLCGRLKQLGGQVNLIRCKLRFSAKGDQLQTLRETKYRNAAYLGPLFHPEFDLASGQQEEWRHKTRIKFLPQFAGDPFGLCIDTLCFLLDHELLLTQIGRIPVFDLNNMHAIRANHDKIDFI